MMHPGIGNRNRLQQHRAALAQCSTAGTKKRWPVRAPNRFKHLDRHDLVKGALHVAVIAVLHVDAIRQTRVLHTLAGHAVLLARDRETRYAAAGRTRGVQRERAPATADFEDMIVGANPEFLANGLVLAPLRPFQIVTVRPDRARVGQARIEEQLEEAIAQIVMGLHVTGAAGARIGAAPMTPRVQ